MGLVFGCSTVVVVLNAITLAFLIIATITAPVVSSLALAEADNIKYGVFGYCSSSTSNSTCSDATFPYSVTSLSSNTNDWKMDDNARDTLSKILIVTPIAAGLTFLSLVFNLFSHFKVFGSSLAFYLIGFLFTALAFFACAITCIVTFLLFFPHVTWCAWLLVPAAILNLFAVPLMFFALRTTPNSFNLDVDEENEDKNLTDLSDGDNFKSNNEFKLDDFTGPNATFTSSNNNSSIDKNIPLSTLKVITNDSSSMTDQRSGLEKTTIHDYSTNKSPTNDFNYNGKIKTQHYGTEGTPNLVSSQNYNRGGAVRSEAPSFKPQSVKPDYSTGATSLYPKSAYQSQQPQQGPRSQQRPPQRPQGQFQSLQQPGAIPRAGNSASSGMNASNLNTNAPPSGVPNSSSSGNNSHSNYTSSKVLGNSNQGSSASDEYDNELTNDNDSDFTSVSQRAVNPRYYRGAQAAPTLFPNQEQQQLVSPSQGTGGYFPSTQQGQMPPQQQQQQQQPPPPQQQQQTYPDYSSSHYSGSAVAPGPYSPQLYQQPQFQQAPVLNQQPQQPQAPRKNTSDVLLSTNPDFMVSGPAFQRQQFPRRTNPQASGGYRPAYKRVQGGTKVTPASLGGDSPYNFK